MKGGRSSMLGTVWQALDEIVQAHDSSRSVLMQSIADKLHGFVASPAAVRKCSSTATRSADDRLPSTRLLAMEMRSAAVVIPRSARSPAVPARTVPPG